MRKGGLYRGDRGLALLLVSLVLLLFVVYPFLLRMEMGRVVVNVSFSFILLASAITVAGPRTRRLLIALVLLTLVTRWWSYATASPRGVALDIVLTIAFMWIAIFLLLVRVFAKGHINVHRILGAVAIYLLIGVVFGLMHFLAEHLRPGSYEIGGGVDSQEALLGHLSYFSFVTLTTTGYGDTIPLAPIARQLAVLEGLIGQLFPAVLLARLVSMELASTGRNDGG